MLLLPVLNWNSPPEAITVWSAFCHYARLASVSFMIPGFLLLPLNGEKNRKLKEMFKYNFIKETKKYFGNSETTKYRSTRRSKHQQKLFKGNNFQGSSWKWVKITEQMRQRERSVQLIKVPFMCESFATKEHRT